MSVRLTTKPIWAHRRQSDRPWDPPFSTRHENDLIRGMFSVVIPVYNGAAYLERSVSSVLQQTYDNFEIIIVDDGSIDDSMSVARSLASEDPRIRVYTIGNSGGPARPRNHAIQRSRGEFIAFLDQDDWWLPQKLERQIKKFREAEYAVVYSDALYVDDASPHSGSLITELPAHKDRFGDVPGRLPEGRVERDLIMGNFAAQLTVAIRAEWVRHAGKMDESAVGVDCYEYLLRVALAGGSFGSIHEPLAVHERGILSRDQDGAWAHSLRFFKDFSERYAQHHELWSLRVHDYENVLTKARLERIRDRSLPLNARLVSFYEVLWLRPTRSRLKLAAISVLPAGVQRVLRSAVHRARALLGRDEAASTQRQRGSP